jgi:prepilin-type N-terminal cleavage/methylation domain-containing protein
MGIPGRRPSATGAGFTLVELVLTVALLLLLAGAVGYSFNSARQGTQLEEGAGQLESLFRFARAQSASTGRRVQVSFVEAGGGGGAPPPPPPTFLKILN